MIEFLIVHIMHRLDTLDVNYESWDIFYVYEVWDFIELHMIKLLNLSLYFAQANSQAKLSNKALIKLIKKKIEDNPRRWHEVLFEVLWAHRISRHSATKVTPCELVYEQ